MDRLQEFALSLVPVERGSGGTVAVDSLLEGPGHPFEIDGNLGVQTDEVTLMRIPSSGTKAFHRLVNDCNAPSPRIVELELKEMSNVT